MGITVVGTQGIDGDVARYLRSLASTEGVRTEGWSLVAVMGDVHMLDVIMIVEPPALLTTLAGFMPSAKSFEAHLIDSGEDRGMIQLHARLAVNVRAIFSSLARENGQ